MFLEEVVVSAPGKVILHGEHAVVYGKTAIAASLNLRSYLRLIPGHDEQVTVNFPSINVCKAWTVRELAPILAVFKVDIQQPERPSEERVKSINKFIENDQESTSPLDSALVAFLYLYTSLCQKTSPPPSLSIKLVSDLPVGAGLGSSASFSVCLATALLLHQQYIKAPIDGEWTANDLGMINMWAFQGERIIHGNPSGIDNSVSTFGGAIKFQSGQITKLDRIPNLKILLTSTKVPRSTKVLVGKVKDRSEKYPGVLTPVMEAIEAVSERCQEIYKEMTTAPGGDDDSSHYTALEELIDINQHLLQVLGVSHVTLDKICHVTSKYRLHSKLTGAGGGGCAFTLLSPSIDSNSVENVKKELEPDGFSCWETDIGGAGVTVHNKVPQCLL